MAICMARKWSRDEASVTPPNDAFKFGVRCTQPATRDNLCPVHYRLGNKCGYWNDPVTQYFIDQQEKFKEEVRKRIAKQQAATVPRSPESVISSPGSPPNVEGRPSISSEASPSLSPSLSPSMPAVFTNIEDVRSNPSSPEGALRSPTSSPSLAPRERARSRSPRRSSGQGSALFIHLTPDQFPSRTDTQFISCDKNQLYRLVCGERQPEPPKERDLDQELLDHINAMKATTGEISIDQAWRLRTMCCEGRGPTSSQEATLEYAMKNYQMEETAKNIFACFIRSGPKRLNNKPYYYEKWDYGVRRKLVASICDKVRDIVIEERCISLPGAKKIFEDYESGQLIKDKEKETLQWHLDRHTDYNMTERAREYVEKQLKREFPHIPFKITMGVKVDAQMWKLLGDAAKTSKDGVVPTSKLRSIIQHIFDGRKPDFIQKETVNLAFRTFKFARDAKAQLREFYHVAND